jgi:hypothetical protein
MASEMTIDFGTAVELEVSRTCHRLGGATGVDLVADGA